MINKMIGKNMPAPGTGAPAGRAVGTIHVGAAIDGEDDGVGNLAVAARGSEVDTGIVGMVFVGVSVVKPRSGKKPFRYAIKSPYRR